MSAECFLLRFCDTNSTIACTEEPDCRMAVSGPATPSVIEACCDGFEDVSCDPKYEVGHEFDVFGEQACQQLSREERQRMNDISRELALKTSAPRIVSMTDADS